MRNIALLVVATALLSQPAEAGGPRTPRHHTSRALGCAVNVGTALAERGVRGTGSPSSLSYLRWGRASGPVPGAVAVYRRPGKNRGHVAIVTRVSGGKVCVMNPGRRAWREVCGYFRRAVAYRLPG
jgi:CHAP domain